MPQEKIKRNPDAAVASAVSQVIQQQKSKRMMMFGLRNLSELCSSSNIKFQENSLAAISNGLVPVILASTQSYGDDEDVILACTKILHGMSLQIANDPNKDIINRFKEDGGCEALNTILSNAHSHFDEETITIALDCLAKLEKLGMEFNNKAISVSLVQCIKKKLGPGVALPLLTYLLKFMDTPENVDLCCGQGVADRVTDILYSTAASNDDTVTKMVEAGLSVLQKVARADKAKTTHMDGVIKCMDTFKSRKTIVDKGSSFLASMLGPEELKKCLNALATAPSGSTERQEALTMLSSMSYISTYADAVVAAGGIQLLCDAVKASVQDIQGGSKEDQLIKGLNGACKMLARIGDKPQNIDAIVAAGGLESLCAALKVTSAFPATLAASAGALKPLTKREDNALQIHEKEGFKVVLDVMNKNMSKPEVLASGVSLLSAGLNHTKLLDAIFDLGTVEVVSKCLAADTEPNVKESCIVALSLLAPKMASFAPYSAAGGHKGLMKLLNEAKLDQVHLITMAFTLVERLADVPDGLKELQKGDTADAVLGCMLAYQCSLEVQISGKAILERIATEDDVLRCLQNLVRCVSGARSDPQKAYKCLAAVNGLSQVARLKAIFEDKEAAVTLQKGIDTWIGGVQFPEQQKIIKAATMSIESLKMQSTNPNDSLINALLTTCMASQVKALIDKQGAKDNNLLDMIHCCRTLSAQRNFDPQNLESLIEVVTKVSGKYQEVRRLQVECLEIMNDLVTVGGENGAKLLCDSGALKNVIGYMRKVAIYEDVQAAGLELLSTILKQDTSSVEPMKFAGGIEMCKAIQGAHAGSAHIRALLQPVATALMPADFLDADVKKAIETAKSSVLDRNLTAAHAAVVNLNTIAGTPDGARSLVHNRVGIALQEISSCVARQSTAASTPLAAETSILIKNVVDTRGGSTHLARCGGLDMLSGLLKVLSDEKVTDSPAKSEGIEANLYAMRLLMKDDKASIEPATAKKLVASFCLLVQAYPDEKRIGGAACAALAAVPMDQLTTSSDFASLLQQMIQAAHTGDSDSQVSAVIALSELMREADEGLVNIFGKEKGIEAMFKALDKYAEDTQIRRDILDALLNVSHRKNLSAHFRAMGGEETFSENLNLLIRALQQCGDDTNSALALLNLINKMTTSADAKLLSELQFNSIAAELLQQHPNSKELVVLVGEILGKSGAGDAIGSLIQQIITAVDSKPKDWKLLTDNLCQRLAIFIPASVDNPKKAFADTQKMCDLLAQVLETEKGDAQLLTSIALVSRRLADKFEDDPNDLKPLETKMVKAMATSLVSDSKAKQNRNFLINGFAMETVMATNPSTHSKVVALGSSTGLIEEACKVLQSGAQDPDVAEKVLAYLAAVSTSPDGMKAMTNAYKTKDPRGVEEALINDILACLRKHKKNGLLTAAGVAVISKLQHQKPNLLNSKYVKEVGSLAEETPEGLAAHLRSLAYLMGHKPQIQDEIEKVEGRFMRMYNSRTTTSQQKENLALAYATFCMKLAASGDVDTVKKINASDLLMKLLNDSAEDPKALIEFSKTLREMADMDADINTKLARQFGGTLMASCAASVTGEPLLCSPILNLLYSLACNEGNGQLLSSTVGFDKLLATIEMAFNELSDKEAKEMKLLLTNLRKIIDQDSPKALTLEQVYEKWNARKLAGETLEIAESAIVLQQFDFVVDYTEDYSRQQLSGIDSALGKEFKFGCLCFSLLHEYPGNTLACIEKGEPKFLLKAIDFQEAEDVVQTAVLVCRDICGNVEGATNFATLSGCQGICVSAVKKLTKNGDRETADELMIPRLELIERTAITRSHYDNTDAMNVLMNVWNDCVQDIYSIETLKRVFRSMRKIVNETWVTSILSNNIPKRLIEVVENKTTDIVLLPDVLFLLGALASVPEIKTLIGTLKGVEACLELLRRCLRNTVDNTSAIQTNGCLAVANITVGHGANIQKFLAAKGVELNVEVMELSMKDKTDYDVANAASVLMCNLCYRRDDIKEIFGKKGGPSAVTGTISKYDGADSKSAFRCMASMLKAIGNLALYTDNIDAFLKQGIESTFAHFYETSEYFPDELLEVSLRTMSNLVLEYTDAYMEKFGVVLLPILRMLQQSSRESVKMLSLAFEVIGNLCRLPDNAKAFADNGGIDTTLRIVNTHTDPRLYTITINVLGVQINNPDSIPKLRDSGVFTFLINLFDSQATADEKQPEVCIAGLRCCRRLLADSSCATTFRSTGGTESIIRLMASCPNLSMVQLDGYKNILTLISFYPPPPPPSMEVEDEWDAKVADEGVLGLIDRIERPPEPRSWQVLGLTATDVRRLVVSICTCLSAEGHGRQMKLQRCGVGLLAYFACEKIPGTVEGFYEGQFNLAIKQALTIFGADPSIVKTCLYVINNILCVSEPEAYYNVAKDKGLLNALTSVETKIPKRDAQYRESVGLCARLLADKGDRDPKKFEMSTTWDYPIELTEWNKDPYPNGIQDLPSESKKALREGGRATLIEDVKSRLPFIWKSSQDLTMLQWKTSKDADASFSNQVSIGRIRNISRGLTTKLLEDASVKDRRIDEKVCLAIIGPPTEEAPNGMQLNLKFSSRKERDRMFEMMSEWRDASTYGY